MDRTDDYRDDHHDELAVRTTRLIAHLDGVLDEAMLDALRGSWSMLEGVATDSNAHARAVRARLFWETMDSSAAPDAAAARDAA